MRFRFTYALVAAISACIVMFGAVAIAVGAPGNGNGNGSANANANSGGGSGSTATSGPGNSSQGCDGTHHSDTGNGANSGGPYDNTCDGSPSGNGNGNGKATGKPCAGCVGNADDKNPGFNNGKGQMPNGSDHNAGYECDRNHGIGRTNPAHTGCTQGTTTPETCPNGQPKPPSGVCESNNGGEKCPNGQPIPPSGKCDSGNNGGETCPNGQPKPPSGDCGGGNNQQTCPNGQPLPDNGNCGGTTTTTTLETPQQAVLGTRESSPEAATAPPSTPNQEVLGARAGGTTPSAPSTSAGAPTTAQRTRAANTNSTLPFTGTDALAVVLAGVLMLLAGLGLRRLAAHSA
jgi:hypothetical protein